MSVLLSSSTPKARKRHRCDWCGELIEIGESYYKYTCVYDGRVQSVKMHSECYKASLEWFCTEGRYEESFDYGEFKRGSWEPNCCEV